MRRAAVPRATPVRLPTRRETGVLIHRYTALRKESGAGSADILPCVGYPVLLHNYTFAIALGTRLPTRREAPCSAKDTCACDDLPRCPTAIAAGRPFCSRHCPRSPTAIAQGGAVRREITPGRCRAEASGSNTTASPALHLLAPFAGASWARPRPPETERSRQAHGRAPLHLHVRVRAKARHARRHGRSKSRCGEVGNAETDR